MRELISKYSGKTVIGVGAHPDDLELGVGGTLARLSQEKARVVMAVVSVPSRLDRRKEEGRRAAEILGCEARFLVPDRCSRVEDMKQHELVDMITGLVSELRPAAVFSHCLANSHVDHTLVYHACRASQAFGFFDLFCYSPTMCRPVSMGFNPQGYVDISATIEKKMMAIDMHRSQFSFRQLHTEQYREEANRYGRLAGVPFAEGLEIVRLSLN